MISQTTYSGTPDDLRQMLEAVVSPLVERIRELEVQTATNKHAYTVNEVAGLIGYSRDSVLKFMHTGRKDIKNRLIRLRYIEITTGDYRILPTDLTEFLQKFKANQ